MGCRQAPYAYTGSMTARLHGYLQPSAVATTISSIGFTGTVDDVRIYGRALPPQEIADLYHAGWQAATLPSGAGRRSSRTSWTAAVPAGLEGSYQIEMRGRDAAEHAEAVSDPSLLWRGEADNLKPRVTLSLNATTNQYTTVAEDYHLVETELQLALRGGRRQHARDLPVALVPGQHRR